MMELKNVKTHVYNAAIGIVCVCVCVGDVDRSCTPLSSTHFVRKDFVTPRHLFFLLYLHGYFTPYLTMILCLCIWLYLSPLFIFLSVSVCLSVCVCLLVNVGQPSPVNDLLVFVFWWCT